MVDIISATRITSLFLFFYSHRHTMLYMKAHTAMRSTILEKSTFGLIIAVAAVVRFAGFPSYSPCFWDEAKYISEVENSFQFFSANAGAFAFLKLAYGLIGLPSYAQIIAGIFGVLAVAGCYFIGIQVFPGQRRGIVLGLLMAGLAAPMPYFVRYSHHAFPEVFALCFFIWAMVFYLTRLGMTSSTAVRPRRQSWRNVLASVALLAAVPACSFKFLLPTFILFLILEFYLWHLHRHDLPKYKSVQFSVVTLIAGTLFFFVIPFILAVIAGYDGWFDRARLLSEAHSSIGTMRPAVHFLFPIHIYYFCGIVFLACAFGGIWVLFAAPPRRGETLIPPAAATVLFLPFAIYLSFFGFLSHLQAARIYVLTVPFLIFAAAAFLLWLRDVHYRIGLVAMGGTLLLTLLSLGYSCRECLNKTTGTKEACDIIAQHIQPDQIIYASMMAQVFYNVYRSPFYKLASLHVEPPSSLARIQGKPDFPPIIIVQDGADVDYWLADRDKYDGTENAAEIYSMIRNFRLLASTGERIYAGEEHFTASPYYFLENIYSWQSYHDLQTLLANSRDSIFIYQLQPSGQ